MTGTPNIGSRRRSLLKIGWLPMDTSHLAEHAGAAGSLFASVFVVATLSMRTMIPLRVFGILTNIVLIATAIPTHNYPTLVLHSVLLALNSYRLHQMLQLVRDVKKSVNSDLSMEWLKPFMTERKCAAGEVLFYKDEKAEDMFYIVSGRFQLVESGIELPVGAIVGELGMLSPSNMRTQTLECIEAGVDPERQLHAGRGALRAESGVRLLLPPALQRPAVPEHRNAGAAAGAMRRPRRPPPRRSRPEGPATRVASVLSSLRYLLADFIGEDDDAPPFLPDGLPDASRRRRQRRHPSADRLSGRRATRSFMSIGCRRFVGRRDVDDAMLGEIARLMAMRMSYRGSDPDRAVEARRIRDGGGVRCSPADDVRKFRLDELIGALPAVVAEPVLDVLEWVGWTAQAGLDPLQRREAGGAFAA